MKLKLILKQVLKDFKNKLQLYTAFIVFIILTVALILGLFSFQFTAASQFDRIMNSMDTVNTKLYQFRFVSKNASKIEHIKTDVLANRTQVDDGSFANYVFDEILKKELLINDEGGVYRPFNEAELKILWNDLGFNLENGVVKELSEAEIQKNYFDYNIIDAVGSTNGLLSSRVVDSYQQQLRLDFNNDEFNPSNDYDFIFNKNHEFNSNLESRPNAVRYAALEKMSLYVRSFDAPSKQFFDRNFSFNNNLLNKYIIEKIQSDNFQTLFSKKGYSVKASYSTNKTTNAWRTIQTNKSSEQLIEELLMPMEPWMDERFDWEKNAELIKNWDHSPEITKRNSFNDIWLIDRLPVDKIDPEVLANGNYGYLNPVFMKNNGLKLGDTINFFSSFYQKTDRSIVIIGTAISKMNMVGQNSFKSSLLIPFFELMKRQEFSLPYYELSISGLDDDFYKANEVLKNNIYDNFMTTLTPIGVDNFAPYDIDDFQYHKGEISMSLYRVLIYGIGIFALILLFVVFYFITEQIIQLQKTTLWFLKSMGVTNNQLSLITTISSLLPILIGTVFGIFVSFGIAQIMISVNDSNLPLDISPFIINPWAFLLLVVVLTFSFWIFLGINLFIIKSGALTLVERSKINITTKMYFAAKPAFEFLKPSIRIGISFIVKNILKNIVTFILLTLAFALVFFSTEFKASSIAGSKVYEQRYQPYESIFNNKQNVNNNVNWKLSFMSQFLPGIEEAFSSGKMDTFDELSKKTLNSSGSIPTFETDTINEYQDIFPQEKSTKELIPIQSNSTKSGDQILNTLFKNQLDELLNKTIAFFETGTQITLNPEYDLKNYYLTKEYIDELFWDEKETILEHALKIFDLTDQITEPKIPGLDSISYYASRLAVLIRTIENKYDVSLFPNLTAAKAETELEQQNNDLILNMARMIAMIQQETIINFTNKMEELKAGTIRIKGLVDDYNRLFNLFFNRNVLPDDSQNLATVFTSNVFVRKGSINNTMINAVGLDQRSTRLYRRIVQPLRIIPLETQGFKTKYQYKESENEEVKEVSVLKGYISKRIATTLHINEGEIIPLLFSNFAFDNNEIPLVYFQVNGIIEDVAYNSEIYFNKVDLFNYLKVNLEEEKTDLDQRFDYAFFKNSYEQLTDKYNSQARYLFNNTVFSKDRVPFGMTNFGLTTKLGTGYSLLSYFDLPTFNYASAVFEVPVVSGINIYYWISLLLSLSLDPIIMALDHFLSLLIVVSAAVVLILVTLILLENRSIILLFKSLGYKKREVVFYLTSGYIVSSFLGLIIGGIVAFAALGIVNNILLDLLWMNLKLVWSGSFILLCLGLLATFITMTLGSVYFYTNKQEPKNAFIEL